MKENPYFRNFSTELILWSGLAFFLFLSHPVRADSVREEGSVESSSLPVCVGYHSPTKTWGQESALPGEWFLCPEQSAVLGVHPPKLYRGTGNIQVKGNCCLLPADGILGEKHVFVEKNCPEDSVVTGFLIFSAPDCGESCRKVLRCTSINTDTYELGPVSGGVRWGISASAAFPWLEHKRIRRDEVPMAIRYGVSRYSKVKFAKDGCVGEPIGSVLVGRGDSRCGSGTFWRELRYRTSSEGTKRSQALKMYPECRDISVLFSPEAECVK